MKIRLLVMLAALALATFIGIRAPAANAAGDATCRANPAEIHIKENAVASCEGFTPNTAVTAYFVEPDGTARAVDANLKTDEIGRVSITFATYGFSTVENGFVGAALGTYTIIVEEKGLANALIHRGETTMRVIGGSEGVKGATLVPSADKTTKAEDVWVYGNGFAPNEHVSFWWEYPNGDCSSFTFHDGIFNEPAVRGRSALEIGTVSADAFGEVSIFVSWSNLACEGTYRIVGRGNTSGLGAETWVSVTGDPVSTNAYLAASPDKVAALFDWVYFTGSGFGANEHISCWLRTPQNQVSVVDQLWQPVVKSDAGGNISFSIYTGSLFPGLPVASEGALGVYAMTCRGDVTGATAIAEFTVTGNTVDP